METKLTYVKTRHSGKGNYLVHLNPRKAKRGQRAACGKILVRWIIMYTRPPLLEMCHNCIRAVAQTHEIKDVREARMGSVMRFGPRNWLLHDGEGWSHRYISRKLALKGYGCYG